MAEQWEYVTLRAIRGDITSYSVDIRDPVYVFAVNGKYIGKGVTSPLGNKTQSPGLILEDFLLQAGREGWELAGMSPLTDRGGEQPGVITLLIVMKRRIA